MFKKYVIILIILLFNIKNKICVGAIDGTKAVTMQDKKIENDSIIGLIEPSYATSTINAILNGTFNKKEDNADDGTKIKSKASFRFEKELIFLMYIFYENDSNWIMKINGSIYKAQDFNNMQINNIVNVIKVDKNSVWFLLKDSSKNKLSLVKQLKDNPNTSYKRNYQIINYNEKPYILFQLFPGQIIDIRNMRIKEF